MHESTETIMKLYLTFHNRTLSRKGFEYRIDANRNTSSYSIFKYQSFEYKIHLIQIFIRTPPCLKLHIPPNT